MRAMRAVQEPQLVGRALALARRSRFDRSCTAGVGRLLAVLAGTVRGGGTVGEIGTGCGVGTAWMASALAPDATLVSVELDPARAEAARDLFGPVRGVRVLRGDWHELLAHGPFDLLFADGGGAKEREPRALVGALRPGGMVFLDDLTPRELWPEEWSGKRDLVREYWLNEPDVAATEIRTGPTEAAIIATRVHAG